VGDDPDGFLQALGCHPRRHLMFCLGLELGFPCVVWPSNGTERSMDGIPAGRFYYEQATRFFPDADIERAIAALESWSTKEVSP
jgi:hypothetical protein